MGPVILWKSVQFNQNRGPITESCGLVEIRTHQSLIL